MIAREINISALREWMAELGKRSSVAVSGSVKSKLPRRWWRWRGSCVASNIWVEYAGIALSFVCSGANVGVVRICNI